MAGFSQAHGTFVYLRLQPKVKSIPATTSGHTLAISVLFYEQVSIITKTATSLPNN